MINIDRYKQLKQCLVIFEALFLKSVVKVDTHEVDLLNIRKEILHLLDGVNKDFVIPVTLLQNQRSHIDLRVFHYNFDSLYLKVSEGAVQESCTLEQAYREYPNFTPLLDYYKENKEKGVVFEDLKFTTTKLLNLIQTTFNMLEDKITRRDEFPDFNIINLLKLINTLHTAEFIFEFTNEHE